MGYQDFMQFAQNGVPGTGAPAQPLNQVVNPVSETTGLNTTPPADENELKQRQSGWSGFFDQLKNDPTMRNTALMVGAQLIGGPQFMGENTGSIFGRAMQAGILTHQMGRANEAKAAEANRQNMRADALAGSQIETNTVGADAKRQKMKHDEETLPLTKKQRELQLEQEQFNTDNQRTFLDDKLKTSASQRAVNAAKVNKLNSKVGGGEGTVPKQSATSELSRLYEIANPDATPQDIAKMVLGHSKKAEGGTDTAKLTTLRTLFENAQDDAERTMYQDLIHQSLGLDSKGSGKEETPAVKFKDPDGFRKAWNNTKEGATFSFEGKKYRKETPK